MVALAGPHRTSVTRSSSAPARSHSTRSTPPTSTHADAVLIVDQLEELFTPGCSPEDRRRSCAHRRASGRCVVTVQADLFGDLVRSRFRPPAGDEPSPARRARDEDLKRVEEPRRCGLGVEPDSPNSSSPNSATPGALLLGHALREAWSRR
jgi:hypothetical protein